MDEDGDTTVPNAETVVRVSTAVPEVKDEDEKTNTSFEEGYVSPTVKTALKMHIGEKRAREEGYSSSQLLAMSPTSSTEFVSSLPVTALPVYVPPPPVASAPLMSVEARSKTLPAYSSVPVSEVDANQRQSFVVPQPQPVKIESGVEVSVANSMGTDSPSTTRKESAVSSEQLQVEDSSRKAPAAIPDKATPLECESTQGIAIAVDCSARSVKADSVPATVDGANVKEWQRGEGNARVAKTLQQVELELDRAAVETNDFRAVLLTDKIGAGGEELSAFCAEQKLTLYRKQVAKLPVPHSSNSPLAAATPLNNWEQVKASAAFMPVEALQNYVADSILNQSSAIVINDRRLANFRKRLHLGTLEYQKFKTLPRWTPEHHFCSFDLRIRHKDISQPEALDGASIWGTDVYTDDSDPYMVLLHSERFGLGPLRQRERLSFAGIVIEGCSGDAESTPYLQFTEGHDLLVTFAVLPKLVRYTGSLRNGVRSLSWVDEHDGESIQVQDVKHVPPSKPIKRPRKPAITARSLEPSRIAHSLPREASKEFAFTKASPFAERSANFPVYSSPSWYSLSTRPASLRTLALGNCADDEGVTLITSKRDTQRLCFKYASELLNYWPPYISKTQPKAETDAETLDFGTQRAIIPSLDLASSENIHAVLQFENWPYWCVKALSQNVVLETTGGERLEIRHLGCMTEANPEAKRNSYAVHYYSQHAKAYLPLFNNLKRDMIKFEVGHLALTNLDCSGMGDVGRYPSHQQSNGKKRKRGLKIVRIEPKTLESYPSITRWCHQVSTGYKIALASFYYS